MIVRTGEHISVTARSVDRLVLPLYLATMQKGYGSCPKSWWESGSGGETRVLTARCIGSSALVVAHLIRAFHCVGNGRT